MIDYSRYESSIILCQLKEFASRALEEVRFNHRHSKVNGRFISGDDTYNFSEETGSKNMLDIITRRYSNGGVKSGSSSTGIDKSVESGIITSEDVSTLEQAKTRDHKIAITSVAISKVKAPNIPVFDEEQNARFTQLHKELLHKSMSENNSNETAFLVNSANMSYVYKHGSQSSVNISDNPEAYSMLTNGKYSDLYLLHNHPSTQTFSYADIGVFLMHDSIKGLTVVTNTGEVQCLFKTDKYNFESAYEVLSNIRKSYSSEVPDSSEDAEIVRKFIKQSKQTGILHL